MVYSEIILLQGVSILAELFIAAFGHCSGNYAADCIDNIIRETGRKNYSKGTLPNYF